jgi:hypothetical protein
MNAILLSRGDSGQGQLVDASVYDLEEAMDLIIRCYT